MRGLGADAISLMIPRPLTFAVRRTPGGLLAGRISSRGVIATGMAALAVSMALFAVIAPDPTTWLASPLSLSGIGVGASLPRVSASVADSVEETWGSPGRPSSCDRHAVGINLLETVQVGRRPVRAWPAPTGSPTEWVPGCRSWGW